MRKFAGQAANDRYRVGCTGQTVYLYDHAGKEMAKFGDIKYGYMPLFAPDGERFAVKSTAGWMAVYDAGERRLIAKWPLARRDSQDHGFCFSADGKYLYNIECAVGTVSTELAVYETDNWTEAGRFFVGEGQLVHDEVEPSEDGCCLLGYVRNGEQPDCFVERLSGGQIVRRRTLTEEEHRELQVYFGLRRYGFTQSIVDVYRPVYEMEQMLRGNDAQSVDWSALGTRQAASLKGIHEGGFVSPFSPD